jgi:hypothetical protein
LIEPTLRRVHRALRGAQILHARARLNELRARLRLRGAGLGLRDVLLARAVLELLERRFRRVAQRDGRLERRVGVVCFGLGDRLLHEEILRARVIELRLVDRHLGLREARTRRDDLLLPRARLRLLEGCARGRRVRARLLELLGTRARFELLQRRPRLLELT